MKFLKRLLLFLSITTFCSTIPALAADTEWGNKALGILGGYDVRNQSAEAGIFFQFKARKHVRIAPDLTYIARRKGCDALSINLNVHVPFGVTPSGRFAVYPLAGLNYTSWNTRTTGTPAARSESNDVTRRINRFGINLGGGVEMHVTRSLLLRFEGKWCGASRVSTGDFSLGIGYTF